MKPLSSNHPPPTGVCILSLIALVSFWHHSAMLAILQSWAHCATCSMMLISSLPWTSYPTNYSMQSTSSFIMLRYYKRGKWCIVRSTSKQQQCTQTMHNSPWIYRFVFQKRYDLCINKLLDIYITPTQSFVFKVIKEERCKVSLGLFCKIMFTNSPQ